MPTSVVAPGRRSSARARQRGGRAAVVARLLARESLPTVACALLVGIVALLIPTALASDGWLALVGGRFIAQHGVPHHDVLTALTNGRAWVDQQWLGQLATYGLWKAGGLRLLLILNALLVAGAFVAAVIAARFRGAQPTTVAIVGLAALIPFVVTAGNVRTQSFAYLPFVGLLAFLARRRPVTWAGAVGVLTLLAVWSNVHGSALLAALLVSARGLVEVAALRRRAPAWFMLVGAWPALLVSPYHVHLVSYYAHTAFNPSFAKYLGQWAPTSLSPVSVPLLVLLFASVWMLGRASSSYTIYERFLLCLAVVLGLVAVRNWAFAALLLLVLAPSGFDRALRKASPGRVPAIGSVVGVGAAAAAIAGIVAALAVPSSHLTRGYPRAAADAAARAATQPRSTIYAGIPFADWLLWSHPELAGRLVFDVRYELLRTSEVKRLVLFDAGSGVDHPLGRPTVYLLHPGSEGRAVDALRPDVRIVYDTDRAVVAVERHAE